MREMKDSGVEWIGKIPKSWELKTIKQLMIERNEKNRDLEVNTILSLSAKDGVTLYDGENHSGNKPREDLSDYKIVRENDVVVNSMNILSGSVGLSKYVGVVSPVYYIYYPRFDGNIHYFHYIFQSFEFQRSLRGLGNGILIKETESGGLNTIRMRIPSKKLGMQEFPICSREEQDRIVFYLDSTTRRVGALIANQEAQIEKLKQYKQSLITEVVTKGLDPDAPTKDSGVEWIGEIPLDWECKPIKNMSSYNDETLGENTDPEFEFDYIEIGSVEFGKGIIGVERMKFSSAPSRARRIVHKNDIIVSTVRTYLKAVAYIPESDTQLIASTGFVVIRPKDIDPSFLKYAILSNSLICKIEANSVGISYPAINASQVVSFKIPVPKLSVQQTISSFLDGKCNSIDKLIAIKQNKIEQLNQFKKSLIYEYVTGKKEVI